MKEQIGKKNFREKKFYFFVDMIVKCWWEYGF